LNPVKHKYLSFPHKPGKEVVIHSFKCWIIRKRKPEL
jgi:hypothetical protein